MTLGLWTTHAPLVTTTVVRCSPCEIGEYGSFGRRVPLGAAALASTRAVAVKPPPWCMLTPSSRESGHAAISGPRSCFLNSCRTRRPGMTRSPALTQRASFSKGGSARGLALQRRCRHIFKKERAEASVRGLAASGGA